MGEIESTEKKGEEQGRRKEYNLKQGRVKKKKGKDKYEENGRGREREKERERGSLREKVVSE